MRFKRILLVLLSLHMALVSNAVDEVRNSRIEGVNINAGKTVSVRDDKFPGIFVSGWNSGFAYMKNKGTVEFGLDESKRALYSSDFSVDITFNVTATDRFNHQQVFTGKTLSIVYKQNGSYTDKAQLVFDGFVKLDVTITNVDAKTLPSGTAMPAVPGELYLEAEIATSRYYPFYPRIAPASAAANLNYNLVHCGSTVSELEVYWDYVPGAEEYELEWTWVNDYTGSAQEYDFKFDATRIITKNTYYRIPLLYEKGYVLYRLRHIGRGGANYAQRVDGAWTAYPEKGQVSAYPTNMKYQVGAYSGDGINWSGTLTFDENSRKGSGVSFMDGMLMGRQSLAKLNTEAKIISQSVIYDYQGRPAISVLPAPVNTECMVRNGMNVTNTNAPYSAADFDKDGTGACVTATDPINVSIGASNYYSSSNPNKEGAQGYLPVADGLPFVQVEYTNDMTGRIKSQTMPGEAHQLGQGKETKFAYSNPGDEELLYLFGSEAGNVSHYDKNVVTDANGQQSASYIDMEGRVIATSLLGPKPTNVDAIDDYNSSTPMTDNMAAYNLNDRNDYSITSVKGVYVENANSVQSFIYEFMPEDFSDACAPSLCFDCIYELEFKITDDCNTDVIPPVNVVVGNVSVANTVLDNCDQPSVKYELSPGAPLQVTFPKTGNYRVSKTLRVSDKNLDLYIQHAIASNTCIPSYNSILNDQIAAIDMSNCDMDCESCSTSVAAYAINYALAHNGSAMPADELQHLYDECSALCIEAVDPCFITKQAMLQDFHPGGQYAEYSISAGNYVVTSNTSVLNTSNLLGISYTNCGLNYVDANGNGNVTVSVLRNSQFVQLPVCSLTVKEFIENFQPSWAQAFLNYHPERCYLTFCEANKASDQYDYGMLEVNTYDEAYAKGYLKPLSGITLPAKCPATAFPANYDPFFVSLAGSTATINNFLLTSGFSTYAGLMMNYVATYPDPTLGSGSIYDIAKAIARNDPSLTSGFGCEPCTKDKEWIMFRNLYLNLKLRIYSQAKTDYVINNGCFNGCMQGSGLQPFTPVSGATPPYTSLYFLQGSSFTFPYTAPSPFYEFYSLAGYPISKSPTVPGYSTVHDGYFQAHGAGFNACAADRSGAFNSKVARFQQLPFSVNGAADYYNNLLNVSPSGPSVVPSNPTASATTANLYCQNTCESYADNWIDKLKNCNPAFDISNGAYNPTIVNMVKNSLIEVCVKGCDKNNPLGSSTVNPALADPAHTGPGYFDSFDEVITYYATTYPAYFPYNANGGCSYLNIDFPEPYGHDYGTGGNSGSANKLDTCGCNKVLNAQEEFMKHQTAGTLPVGVSTAAQYFGYLYNASVVNFNEISCKCASVSFNSWYDQYPWTQSQSEALLSSNIGIPDILACSRCLPCSTVVAAVNSFNAANPGWVSSPLHDELMENSLNASLNMNMLASEYLAFYNNCTGASQPASSCNASNVRLQLVAYVNTYIALAKAQPLTGGTSPVVLTLSKSAYPSLFGSCLFPCSDDANLPTMVTITIDYKPPYVDYGVPYPSKLDYNNPAFHYYGGIGACSQFDCNPKFDVLADAFVAGVTSYQVTDLVFSGHSPSYNLSMSGTYTDGSGTHTFGGIYPLFNYPCINPEYLTPSGEPKLCNQPYNPSGTPYNDCYSSMVNQAEANAKLIYQSYIDRYVADFKKKYKEHCFKARETYTRAYELNEYHYTLYYYDQAGSLTRTVPPKGVQKLTATQVALLKTATPPVIYPSHAYVTHYKYQSYGAPVASKTPDETDLTEYVYDNIGRIQLSYNAKQKQSGKFSYTLYDELGRISEVGVLGNLPSGYDAAYFRTIVANNTFEAFVNAPVTPTIKSEVIKTYYDYALNVTISGEFRNGQDNLRNRVATVTYEDVDDFNPDTYTYASHYTYDVHGNVGRVVQDVPALSPFGREFYKMDYEYDLISGNVNKVTYQPGREDQFMHKYEYDADNRLHRVYTSKDNINWDRDAKYFYYEHGPLARTELGDAQVQGTDFAYTIHGWVKAVNSDILESNTDIGKDGAQGNTYYSSYYNMHQYTAQDAAGYSLNYYQQATHKDYTAIKSFNGTANKNLTASTANILTTGSFNLSTDAPDLYNGNISSMVTSIYDIDPNTNNTHAENTAFPQITGYRYDQLHRLTQMKAFRDISISTNAWNAANSGTYDGSYFTSLSYDKNGNITHQRRDGAAFMTGLGLAMDDMTYIPDNTGALPNNKLVGVNDVGGGTYTIDIKDASAPVVAGNSATFEYEYDEIGSLKKDKKEFIGAIEWTVDRKVKKVVRDVAALISANKNMPDLEFEYDANRQRIVKIVKPHDNSTKALLDQSHWVYTYYVRDASGNISATYEKSYAPVSGQPDTYTETLKLQEHDVYGSARLGTIPANQVMGGNNIFTATISGGLFTNINYIANYQPPVTVIVCTLPGSAEHIDCEANYDRKLGNKRYELTNHLGNVLTVISDRKLQKGGSQSNLEMVRNFDDGNMTQVIGDPPSCVSLVGNQALVYPTGPYSGINFDFLTTAGETYVVEFDLDAGNSDASDNMNVTLYDNTFTLLQFNSLGASINGHHSYTWTGTGSQDNIKIYFTYGTNTPLSGAPIPHYFKIDNFAIRHINPAVTVVTSYMPEILETHDYYAFGMEMPGRSVGSDYKYGMNGQMKEGETFEGAYSAEFWTYDSRLGRRWEVDPVVKHWEAPYATFNNNPIYYADPDGLDGEGPNGECPGDPGYHTYNDSPKKSPWERQESVNFSEENNFSQLNTFNSKPPLWKFWRWEYWEKNNIEISLGNTFSLPNQANGHTDHHGAMIYSPNQDFYQTDILHPFSLTDEGPKKNDLTEGNHTFKVIFGKPNKPLKFGVIGYKEKTEEDANGYSIEAPGPFSPIILYNLSFCKSKYLNVDIDLGGGTGLGIGAPRINGKMEPGGFWGYRLMGSSQVMLAKVNVFLVKTIVLSVFGTYTHMNIKGYSGAPVGSQDGSSYDSFSVKASVGFILGRK